MDKSSSSAQIKPSQSNRSRYTIGVLAKACDLLEILAENNAGLSLAALCRRLELPKSSVYRYLVTLEERGYVARSPDTDEYRLGFKLFELGSLAVAQIDVGREALPFMRQLLDTFRETVNLAVLSGTEVIYLKILESPQSIRMVATPGHRDFVHATALGKAILAYLPEQEVEAIVAQVGLPALTSNTVATTSEALRSELARVRTLGYAVDNIENELGVRCVGAPIFNHRAEAIAAISISGPADRMPLSQIDTMGRELARVALTISTHLGYAARPSDASDA